jgi:hypothetical protein
MKTRNKMRNINWEFYKNIQSKKQGEKKGGGGIQEKKRKTKIKKPPKT